MRAPLRLVALASTLSLTAAAAAQSPERTLWRDLDRDGLPDLYVRGAGRDDVLLRNAGDGGFVDVTAEAGLAGRRSQQVLPGGFDGDGHEDLVLVTRAGELRLLRGLGELTFEDATTGSGLEVQEEAVRAERIDFDRDGWEDLKIETASGEPVLFRNLEGLHFDRVDLEITTGPGPAALAATVGEVTAPETEKSVSRPGGRTPVEVGSRSVVSAARNGKQALPLDPSLVGLGGTAEAVARLFCAKVVEDAATGNCVSVSSTPTMGMLYPLSANLYVDAATGWVGIGTTSPTNDLTVAGNTLVQGNSYLTGKLQVLDGGLPKVELSENPLTGGQLAVTGVSGGGVQVLGGLSAGGARVDVSGLANPVASLKDANQVGLLTLYDGSVFSAEANVELYGRHLGGEGGSLVLNHAGNGTETVELLADNGSDAGALSLIDRSPGGTASAYLSAGGFGSGSQLLLTSGDGEAGLTVRGGNANEGGVLTVSDGAGIPGVTVNGELGGSPNLTLWEGFDPGVTLDASRPGGQGGSITLHDGLATNVQLQGNDGIGKGRILLGDGTADTVVLSAGDPTSVGGSLTLYDQSAALGATARLRVGTFGGQLLLEAATGRDAVILHGGTASTGGSLNLIDVNDETAVLVSANADAGTINLYDDNSRGVDIHARGTSGNGGQIALRQNSDLGVWLQADAGNGEGRIALRDGSFGPSKETVVLQARRDGTGEGGAVSVFNDKGGMTARILGDEGNDSGRFVLWNKEGINDFISASLRAVAGAGKGAQLRLRDEANILTVDLDATSGGVPTQTGALILREGDASIAWRMKNDVFEGRNSAGAVTISYNRNTGAKNAVVATERYGQRTLYCEESTEVWFSDYGSGRLTDGTAWIELDPIFLETVVVDAEHPLKVFLTPTAPIGEYWVEKRARGFVVHADDGAEGTFDWRVVAKRRGLEDARLEPYAAQR